MMNVIKKINIIFILMILIILIFSSRTQATIGNIFQDADDFLGKGNLVKDTINEPQLQETSKFLYKLLLAIGIIVMFIVGTILGIQFMVASAEDKAKVKEALVPYIVGCVVIFGAFTIWGLAVNIGQDITDDKFGSLLLGDETREKAILEIRNDREQHLESSKTYYGISGLKAILETYFEKEQYKGGAPYNYYHLKDEYATRIENNEISITYWDYYDSTKYVKKYMLTTNDFDEFPKRAFEIDSNLLSY